MTRLLKKLPYSISHFLGYRKPNYTPKKIPQWRIYFWSFLAAWIGIALLEIIFTYSFTFQSHQAPMIIASFGASAVLIYGVVDSPLAQPRNVVCGQLVGSIVGVIIAQLFLTIPPNWWTSSSSSTGQRIVAEWIGGATAMALALTIMQITKTVHPPGGATALIAVITPDIVNISWFYIAIIVLSSVMQVVIGCLVNNVERRYPHYWWTPPHAAAPIQFDRAILSTRMMSNNTDADEEVVENNLLTATAAAEEEEEEGTLFKDDKKAIIVPAATAAAVDQSLFKTSTASSSSSTLETTSAIEHALYILQKHVNDSRIPYLVISDGLPPLTTTWDLSLLDDTDKACLERLSQKISSSVYNMEKY
ncbi:HPP family-domain-containing protein [Pilaira anomala]|nr:HPP family-domain-containing protein [Pilaira anomala]